MPRKIFGPIPDVEPGMDYANNGRVTGIYCINNTGRTITIRLTLDDGTTYEHIATPGTTSRTIPSGLISLSVGADGEVITSGSGFIWRVL